MTGAAAVPVVVLAAALLHAVWNALAHKADDRLAVFVLMNLATTGCAAVVVCLTPLPDPRAWPYLAASAVLQVAYQALLLQAYRLGDFGQMYPIARGTSPLLVALVSATALGQRLSAPETLGVLVISLGLVGLALADGLPGRAQLPALAAALGTGVMIASYTLVDGSGVRQSPSGAVGYVAWLFLCQGPVLPLLAWALRGRSLTARLRPVLWRGLAGGVLSLLAYGLVVWAQAHGSLATVAALRETSIVFAALIGLVLFREPFGRRRVTAGALVVTGIAVLELAHP
ncbi:EamA family transporter [Streptomyces sp. SP18ES09]|uniref:EamA family transporter n=1 Tax=Streptomyces sp. SP18ES09 TaxID=3002532 RepID=UPI002E78C8FA|nr:EamA family transporter [Streptomyces sp. SP18ES09]MEE1819813.1 EamA family transporter [Streptomyces sp. SP18ES09]